MPIICVSMELGALSKEVTEGLAAELALRLVYPQVLNGTAQRMGTPTAYVKRVVEGRAGLLDRRNVSPENLKIFVGAELTAIAAQDNVAFRGWGAEELFRSVPQVASIRITAPFEDRVRNLMESLDTDDREEIVRAIRRSDAAYASSLYQNGQIENFGVHHLVLNTGRCTIDHCVQQIVALMEHPQFQQTEESHKMLANMALEASVRAALRRAEGTRTTNVWIRTVDGVVWLEGMVETRQEREVVETVAASEPGVAHVYNMLRTMREGRHFTRTAANF
jgi:cytidylate kinase-like protein/BON domain-containing protein